MGTYKAVINHAVIYLLPYFIFIDIFQV